MHNGLNVGYVGVGRYLPEHILTNNHLEQLVDTSDEWITQRTGIRSRRMMGPEDTLVSMATKAAENAIKHAGIEPSQITEIRVGVNTHLRFPSLACMVQDKLGIKNANALDINAGCPAFIFAVHDIYNKMIADWVLRKETSYALAIGVDGMSLVTDYTDRSTCVLFGDGAGAAVIGPVESGGILATYTRTQGNYWDMLTLDELVVSPLDNPEDMSLITRNGRAYPYLHMVGKKVFPVAVRSMMADIHSVVDRYNSVNDHKVTLDDINFVIPHQANLRIVDAVRKGLKLNSEQVHSNGVKQYGNTSTATIPIAYVEEWNKRPGTLEVDVSFGAGFASGAVLWKTPEEI